MTKRVYIIYLVVIWLLPYISDSNYNSFIHTTSQLGGHHMPYGWVMSISFCFMAASIIFDAIKKQSLPLAVKTFLILFGLSFFMTGIFRHQPIDETLLFNQTEDAIHSIFATLTGFSFAIFAATVGFTTKKKQRRFAAFFFVSISIIVPLMMQNSQHFSGLLQRLMMMLAIFWMIIILEDTKGF